MELDAHEVGHPVQESRHLLQLFACMLHTARPGMVDEEDAVGVISPDAVLTGHNDLVAQLAPRIWLLSLSLPGGLVLSLLHLLHLHYPKHLPSIENLVLQLVQEAAP